MPEGEAQRGKPRRDCIQDDQCGKQGRLEQGCIGHEALDTLAPVRGCIQAKRERGEVHPNEHARHNAQIPEVRQGVGMGVLLYTHWTYASRFAFRHSMPHDLQTIKDAAYPRQ